MCFFGWNGQVYFADFLNQRLRKLVKINSDWYIYTVAGTGASWCFLKTRAVCLKRVVGCFCVFAFFSGALNYIVIVPVNHGQAPHRSTGEGKKGK